MRRAVVLTVLCLAGCSSAPTAERQQVPDRPEVPRPEGVEPDGLADVRDSLGEQRAAARARENALVMKPHALSTTSTEASWTDDALSWIPGIVGDLFGIFHKLFF